MSARSKLISGILLGGFALLSGTPRTSVGAAANFPTFPSFPKEAEEENANPYSVISERNVFRLNTPPQPPDPEASKPPPDVPKVTLSGFEHVGSQVKVLLAVHIKLSPSVAGAPAEKTDYYVMSQGEIEGPVQLVKVNAAEESVDIINSGAAMTLTMKKDGYAQAPSAVRPPANARVGRAIPGGPQPAIGNPTEENNGGTMVGGRQAPQPKPFSVGRAQPPGDPYANTPYVGGASAVSSQYGSTSSRIITGGASISAPAGPAAAGAAEPTIPMPQLMGLQMNKQPLNVNPAPPIELAPEDMPPIPHVGGD